MRRDRVVDTWSRREVSDFAEDDTDAVTLALMEAVPDRTGGVKSCQVVPEDLAEGSQEASNYLPGKGSAADLDPWLVGVTVAGHSCQTV